MLIRKSRSLFLVVLILYTFGSSTILFAEDDGHRHAGDEHSEEKHEHGDHEDHDSHDGHKDDHKTGGHVHSEESADSHRGHDEHGHGESSPVEWTEKLLHESHIELKSVSSGQISVGLELPGKIVSYEPNVAHIIPRFPGIIREARKHLGESVKKGDVLAVIESNQSLNPYEVKSPITGVVVKRHSTVGEYASETTDIFVVADLSKVWGEFYVFSDDFGKIERGAPVSVEAKPLKAPIRSTVSFVSKIVDEHTQSKFIRTILENPKGELYPGAFANALVELETVDAELVVDKSALQRLEGRDVVFVWEGETFEPRPVVTGKHDKQSVVILSGLKAGEKYASGNTFLIKAEVGKSEAEHAH